MIVEPRGPRFSSRDYLSVVFDESTQTHSLPCIPSTSNVTVKIFGEYHEDEDELEEDPDKTITLADFSGDGVALPVYASPAFREWLGGRWLNWD